MKLRTLGKACPGARVVCTLSLTLSAHFVEFRESFRQSDRQNKTTKWKTALLEQAPGKATLSERAACREHAHDARVTSQRICCKSTENHQSDYACAADVPTL